MEVAASRNTPAAVLSRLSTDSDSRVREATVRKEKSSIGSSEEEEFKRKQREDWQRIANQIEAEKNPNPIAKILSAAGFGVDNEE